MNFQKIKEISKYRRGSFPQPYTDQSYYGGEGSMPFVQVADVTENLNLVEKTKNSISKKAQSKSVYVPKGTVLVTLQGSIGRVAITQYDSYVDRTLMIFTDLDKSLNKEYFAYALRAKFEKEKKHARGITIKTITKEEMEEFLIPIPSLEKQKEIVNYITLIKLSIDEDKRKISLYDELLKSRFNVMFDCSDNSDKKLLRDFCEVITKGTTPTTLGYQFIDEGINFVKIECITNEHTFLK